MRLIFAVSVIIYLLLGVSAASNLCESHDAALTDKVTATVGEVLSHGEQVPGVLLHAPEREALSPFACHNAVLVQRMDGTAPKESAYARIEMADDADDGLNVETIVCDGDHCDTISQAEALVCNSVLSITKSLADALGASEGDTITLKKITSRADVEYREVKVAASRSKKERLPFVVAKHPVDTYEGEEENVYCQRVPTGVHRLTQNVNMPKERPLPVAAEVMGVLPAKYVSEIVLKYGQISAMDLPIPYPFLTLTSAADRERTVEDVSIRLYDAPPYRAEVTSKYIGELYKSEAMLWMEDASSRGLQRPFFETIDGMPDDGVFITSAVADKLGLGVGDFIVISGIVSHDAYAYKKEIQHLKRQLQQNP